MVFYLYLVRRQLFLFANTQDQKKQVKFPHRNNRSPELIGLRTTQLHNIDHYNFVIKSSDLPNLLFNRYTIPTVYFTFEAPEYETLPFGVPQGVTLKF